MTLYAFWALGQREGEVRYLQLGDFTNDPILLKAMGGPASSPASIPCWTASSAPWRAARSLKVEVEGPTAGSDSIFSTPSGGAPPPTASPAVNGGPRPTTPAHHVADRAAQHLRALRAKYRALTPIIADELRDAEQPPARWIEEGYQTRHQQCASLALRPQHSGALATGREDKMRSTREILNAAYNGKSRPI